MVLAPVVEGLGNSYIRQGHRSREVVPVPQVVVDAETQVEVDQKIQVVVGQQIRAVETKDPTFCSIVDARLS